MTSSLWILVAVFVVLGLAVLFLLMNVFLQQRNAKLTFGVMGAGLFGVSLGWGAFYGGVIMTGQEMAFGVSGFEAETIDVTASEDTAPASAEGADAGGGGGGMGGGMMGGGGMGGGGMGGMMGGM
ncbi:MAG TPA: hypothetical protein DCE39_18515, partial [Planctomycetaceae bacterium]|nr:hypothetical protein [Planctomycetaceae bacterium]